ncbi:MAG TPA: class IV adenylate cyclase [Thermoanaerobaculia bacterium]|nr:class IV adenylate cyclase [Thermoanaerobaculia bacterium]
MSARLPAGVEREIKVPVAELAAVRDRLVAVGAVLEAPHALERNRVYERADGSDPLLSSGRLLRLREDGAGARLTYKGVARFEAGQKIREEREIEVDSARAAAAILEGLGFVVVRRYEKRRETWRLGDVLVALDETPIGCFVELEAAGDRPDRAGSGEAGAEIETAARRLGLDPSRAEPRSYLALYEAWRARHPEAPPDMAFDPPKSSAAGQEPGA